MASTRRKSAAIALAVIGIAGLSLASAATLNVNSGSLGANSAIVASCQADDDGDATNGSEGIDVGFTNSFSTSGYVTDAVVLSNVDAACVGNEVRIQLTDAAGAALGAELVADSTGASQTFAFAAGAGVSAELVEGFSIVISG